MIKGRLIKYIKNPKNILFWLDNKNIIRMNDKEYIKILYYNRFNRKIDLNNPKTFNEKLQWLKLYDRNPEYTMMVDKSEAKKYVSKIIGDEYIIPTIGVYDRFSDIDFDKLPNQFVIKCTHDSGGVIICKDKSSFNIKECKKKINKSLKYNYFYAGREWPYKNVRPRIIIEKYLNDEKYDNLLDYKLMCFNGKVKMSFTCSERYSENGLCVDFFDLHWNKLEFTRHYPNSQKKIEKPINYETMIKLAEKISKNIPFVRIDFYEINGRVYFGEITFYPGGGLEEFKPEKYDCIIGDMINLNKEKNNEK